MAENKPAASKDRNTSRHKSTERTTARLPIGVRAQFARRAEQLTKLTGRPVTGHSLMVDVLTTAATNQLADEINQTGITPPGVSYVRHGETIEVLTYGPPMP